MAMETYATGGSSFMTNPDLRDGKNVVRDGEKAKRVLFTTVPLNDGFLEHCYNILCNKKMFIL